MTIAGSSASGLSRKELLIDDFTDHVADKNVGFLDARGGLSFRYTQKVVNIADHLTAAAAGQADGFDP